MERAISKVSGKEQAGQRKGIVKYPEAKIGQQ
jgi:hypothetical protein